MIIKVNKLTCERDLRFICFFAYRILRYASSNGNPFDEADFIREFGTDGQWFLSLSRNKSEKSVRTGLEGIFKHNQSDRLLLKEVFRNDVRYTLNINKKAFKFKAPDLREDLLKSLENFLVPFYDKILKRGFELKGLQTADFCRKNIEEGFRSANKETIRICPVCLQFMEKDKDKEDFEIDHYFPKSKYPVFSLFADNLLPICGTCNGPRYKHTKDPLGKKQHGEGCLLKVYIPYHREAADEIMLGFDDGKVFIVPKNAKDDNAKERIKNLQRLYKLDERWSSYIEVDFLNICERIDKEIENKEELLKDTAAFAEEVERIAKSFAHKKRMAFLVAEYLKYIAENPPAGKAAMLCTADTNELKRSIKGKN